MSAEAARIVADLIARGFSQTDIARGLGLGAKGSGSYVGQILKGTKGSQKIGELQQLQAAAVSAGEIPAGRGAAAKEARQRILSGARVRRTPRQRKAGGDAAVRKAATAVSRRGFVSAYAGQQALDGPRGGRPIEDAIRGLATVGGRIALRVVGRFPRESAAHRSSYWQNYYGKKKRKPGRKRGSSNVLEVAFGNGGRGFAASDWAGLIDASGTFAAALNEWMIAQGHDIPERLVRVELTGWVET
ncbi:hypothetical protein GCM10010387_67380 [Streptomyces inusitatus]|uniref:Uncharacterized protein n=1 Tax=Streptomyces inusitatus TaxID=68221 RepID=A0A918QRJ7_9ACTN|nr:hypothetical protein [Streptomyces inusitatus]GGZ64827.1 hypothetical protein GCM10010387_67380 [Streptomyces inusitatus]